MNPKHEIEIHLKKLQRKLAVSHNEYDDICREINRLNFEDAHLTDHSRRIKAEIECCEQLLRELEQRVERGTSYQLKIDLRKFKRENSKVDNRRSEVQHDIEILDCKVVNLLDQSQDLWAMIELCQRALDGEDVSIWAEIQRFESKESEKRRRVKRSSRNNGE